MFLGRLVSVPNPLGLLGQAGWLGVLGLGPRYPQFCEFMLVWMLVGVVLRIIMVLIN